MAIIARPRNAVNDTKSQKISLPDRVLVVPDKDWICFSFFPPSPPFDFHRANYQWESVVCEATQPFHMHACISCIITECTPPPHPTSRPLHPPSKKASYTGALFKRQRIDGNLRQWRAGHSWVSISPLSLWTPGSTAAQHNAPLSPPAFTPVPRGEMDKREKRGRERGERPYLSRCLTLYVHPKPRVRKRVHYLIWGKK